MPLGIEVTLCRFRSLWSLILLLLLFLTSVSAQNYCYYGPSQRAGSAIIPCGGTGGSAGYSACCQLGDECLSDSACWNRQANVTYLYGCTDPTYTDPSCPWKCGSDFDSSPWVGLEYCANTTTNEWACTHPPPGSDAVEPNAAQLCTDDSIIAFAGPVSLQPILSLPTDVGGSTLFFSLVTPGSYTPVTGYTPTSTSIAVIASVPTEVESVGGSTTTSSSSPTSSSTTSTSTSTSSTTTSTTTSSPSYATSTSSTQTFAAATTRTTPSLTSPTATVSPSTSLSTASKAGIGVGVTGFVLFVAAAILFALMLRRRKRRQTESALPQSEVQQYHGKPSLDDSNAREFLMKPARISELPDGNDARPASELYGGPEIPARWNSPAPTYESMEVEPGTATGFSTRSDSLHEIG